MDEILAELYEKNLEKTRKKLRESVSKDILLVQAIKNIEDLNKVINTLMKDLREWYGFYNPELVEVSGDKLVFLILDGKDSKNKNSVGADLGKDDLEPMKKICSEIKNLSELKEKQVNYLEGLMKGLCPNLTAVAGALIGAKLIERAGSLKHLSELPASTIQLLGAEKALFRHIRNKKNLVPKYGVIYDHQLIANAKNKGKMARKLADKIAIAVRVDYFKGKFVGDKLRKGLEK